MTFKIEFIVSKMSDIVVLNIGGTKFITNRSTLLSKPGSLLTKFFSSNSVKPNFSDEINKEQYFFDYDPKYFEYILNFYRDEEVIIPRSLDYEIKKKETTGNCAFIQENVS